MVNRKMTKIQEEVWNFLLTRHAGEENAMPRAAILTRFNLVRHKTISDREFREIVSELVTVYRSHLHDAGARLLRRADRGGEESRDQLPRLGVDRGRRSAPGAGRGRSAGETGAVVLIVTDATRAAGKIVTNGSASGAARGDDRIHFKRHDLNQALRARRYRMRRLIGSVMVPKLKVGPKPYGKMG
jgi:hypothetical protein